MCYGKYEIEQLICILKKSIELLFRFNEIIISFKRNIYFVNTN